MLTLGADPEFVFLDSGNHLVSANQYLRFGGKMGTDGCMAIAELRPSPSTEPEEVTKSMFRAMNNRCRRTKELVKYKWRAGSYCAGRALGGHIHIGFDDSSQRAYMTRIVEAFDELISPIVMMLEDKDEAVARRNGSYGRLSAYETKIYGFEYRTLPSFIVNPAVTTGILAMARVIAEQVVADKSWARVIAWNSNKFMACDKSYFHDIIPRCQRIIEKMKLFKEHKAQIKLLWVYLQEGIVFSNFEDMKESWRLKVDEVKKELQQRVIPIRDAEEVWGTL